MVSLAALHLMSAATYGVGANLSSVAVFKSGFIDDDDLNDEVGKTSSWDIVDEYGGGYAAAPFLMLRSAPTVVTSMLISTVLQRSGREREAKMLPMILIVIGSFTTLASISGALIGSGEATVDDSELYEESRYAEWRPADQELTPY